MITPCVQYRPPVYNESPAEEITYFYGNRLYVMAGIGPVPAGQVNIKAGPSSREEDEHGGNDD